MKRIDSFEFKDLGGVQNPHIDYTPYDDDIPKEFRVEEPGPPPFDVEYDSPALDLIAWAFDQIG